ncbi:MAG: hypothetical protein ABUT39_08195 [Acidobacteriota bacterium]
MKRGRNPMPAHRASGAHLRVRVSPFEKSLPDLDQGGRMEKRASLVDGSEDQLFAHVIPARELSVGLDVEAVAHETALDLSFHGFEVTPG